MIKEATEIEKWADNLKRECGWKISDALEPIAQLVERRKERKQSITKNNNQGRKCR